MNKIFLKKTSISGNCVLYEYEIEGEWKKYFTNKREYSIKYEKNIEQVPKSICNIQFVSNILPLVWMNNAELNIEELDENYYNSIQDFKNGYVNMYPMLRFKGSLNVKNIIQNTYELKQGVGAFFSGGLDATSTMASHFEENPLLINIQGSDINLKYKNTSAKVKEFLKEAADELKLDITFIDSEFRQVINEKNINRYLKPIVHDNYWHGFQHGIAIISHAAPIAYLYGLENIYIASSFTEKTKIPCASDPTIDNYVKLSLTNVIHDGFEYDRIDKSNNVANFIKKYNKKVKLRVCLDDYRANNCCNCEKCFRTIFNFAANGIEPNEVGFDLKEKDYKRIENKIKNKIFIQFPVLWNDIKKAFHKHPELKNDNRYTWIYEYDFSSVNDKKIKYVYKVYYAIVKRVKRFVKMILR